MILTDGSLDLSTRLLPFITLHLAELISPLASRGKENLQRSMNRTSAVFEQLRTFTLHCSRTSDKSPHLRRKQKDAEGFEDKLRIETFEEKFLIDYLPVSKYP